MKKFKEDKRRHAQQLVEFLLVAPFVIIILGIVMEYAYSFNVNLTLANGLKTVTSEIYQSIKPNMSATDIQTLVLNNLTDYMSVQNNIGSGVAGDGLTVSTAEMGDNTVFIAEYIYSPAFTLPNVYFHFLPDKFDFIATSVVPTSFLRANNYGNSINTTTLNGAWTSQNGVINPPNTGGNLMLFLSPATAAQAPLVPKPYQIMPFNGVTEASIVSLSNGLLYSCTPILCTPTGQTFFAHYPGYTNIIFVHDAGAIMADVIKRATSIVDINNKSVGNYDNIDVSTYNSTVAPLPKQYTARILNNRVFVYTATDAAGSVMLP